MVLTSALVSAQSFSIAAPSAMTLSAQVGANQNSDVIPAGPLALSGSSSALAYGGNTAASASAQWYTQSAAGYFELYLAAHSTSYGTTQGQADTGPIEFLLSISNPTQIVVSLELTRTVFGSPGNPMPLARVDVDDDGILELDESMPNGSVNTGVMVGPTTTLVRITVSAEVLLGEVTSSAVNVIARPGQTYSFPGVSGCSGASYVPSPRFDGNLDYRINNVFAGSSVAVFSLAEQPMYLGSASFPGGLTLPCVLMPRPDFVAFLPTAAPQTLVIPPAARPLQIYTQAVSVSSGALLTSNAFRINAL